MLYLPVILVRLWVTVQVIGWKDSSLKWPVMCWWGRWILHTVKSQLQAAWFRPDICDKKGSAVNLWAKSLLKKSPLHKKPHWTEEGFNRQ